MSKQTIQNIETTSSSSSGIDLLLNKSFIAILSNIIPSSAEIPQVNQNDNLMFSVGYPSSPLYPAQDLVKGDFSVMASHLWVLNRLIAYLWLNYQSRLRKTNSKYLVLQFKFCQRIDSLDCLIAALQQGFKRAKKTEIWHGQPFMFKAYFIIFLLQKTWKGEVDCLIISEKCLFNEFKWEEIIRAILPQVPDFHYKQYFFSSVTPLDGLANIFTRLAFLFSEACNPSGFWASLKFQDHALYSSAFMDPRSLFFVFQKKLRTILNLIDLKGKNKNKKINK